MADLPRLATPRLVVTMDDGAVHEIQTYNRDMLAWDRTRARRQWPLADQAPFVWLTFLAWTALSREGQITKMTLDEFEERALEVRAVQDEDGGEAGADPTQKDPGPI